MADSLVLTLPLATASQMGGKSPSTATLHTKWRWMKESVATIPIGAAEEGEGNATPNLVATTTFKDAANVWMVAL